MNKLEASVRLKATQVSAALVSDKVALAILKDINDSPELKHLQKKLNKDKLAIFITSSMDEVKKALVLLGWVRAEGRPLPKEMVLTHPNKTWPLHIVYQSSTNLVKITCAGDSVAKSPRVNVELAELKSEFGDLKVSAKDNSTALVELAKPLPSLTFFDRAARVGYQEADTPVALYKGQTCLYAKLNDNFAALLIVIESKNIVKDFSLAIVRVKR